MGACKGQCMTAPTYRSLSVSRADHVVGVVLQGPGKGNAMGPDFWREVPELFAALEADEDCRCVILRGSGGHFSYGLDLPAMMGALAPLLAGEQLASGRQRLLDLIGR